MLLQSLGLSQKEAATYLAILELGSSTVLPIAKKAGVKRTSIYNFIDNLVELGIIKKLTVRGRQYFTAESPEKLVELQEERLRVLKRGLPKLLEAYDKSRPTLKVSYFNGPQEVRNIVREEIFCKKHAFYIWPGQDIIDMIGGVESMSDIDKQRIEKGVHINTIRFRQKDVTFPTSAQGKKYLRSLRFAPGYFNVSMGMGIYDTGKVGFFSSSQEGFGLLIESKELSELMLSFYRLIWNDSIPAREGEG